MSETWVIIPCYNEEKRLEPQEISGLFARPEVRVLFVNDGSKDDTLGRLREFASRESRVAVLDLERNQGKAEAVRRGLLEALGRGATIVGYLDADMATPAAEALFMLEELDRTNAKMIMGSRVRLLGRHIEREPGRHYLGRVFATVASWALRLSVYDTQCGAKLFQRGAALDAALAEPFSSRWAFDVELIFRLISAPSGALTPEDIVEVPLREWRDKAGSKLTTSAMLKAGLDLLQIGLAARRRRAPSRTP